MCEGMNDIRVQLENTCRTTINEKKFWELLKDKELNGIDSALKQMRPLVNKSIYLFNAYKF